MLLVAGLKEEMPGRKTGCCLGSDNREAQVIPWEIVTLGLERGDEICNASSDIIIRVGFASKFAVSDVGVEALTVPYFPEIGK